MFSGKLLYKIQFLMGTRTSLLTSFAGSIYYPAK